MKNFLMLVLSISFMLNMAMAMSPIAPLYYCENDDISIEIYDGVAIVMLEGTEKIYQLNELEGPSKGKKIFLSDEDLATVSFKKGLFPKAKFSISKSVKKEDGSYKVSNILEISARCKK